MSLWARWDPGALWPGRQLLPLPAGSDRAHQCLVLQDGDKDPLSCVPGKGGRLPLW